MRLAAMGIRDPRRVWLRRWLPVAGMFLAAVASVALLISLWSGESMATLVSASVSASVFALGVAYAVNILSGAAPGVAAFATTVLVAGAMLAPPQLGLAPPLSLSPGPLGWLRGEPYRWAFAVHALVVVTLAAIITLATTFLPRDVRDIRWIAGRRGKDA